MEEKEVTDLVRTITHTKYVQVRNPLHFILTMVKGVWTLMFNYMLFQIFNTKVEKSPLLQDIDIFLATRGNILTRRNHKEWLYKFAEEIGKETPEDLEASDITIFLKALEYSVPSTHQRTTAATALNLYVAYRRRLNAPKRGVGRPSKRDRNREMYLLYCSSKDWTYRKLAERYRLDVSTVFEVVKRYEKIEMNKEKTLLIKDDF